MGSSRCRWCADADSLLDRATDHRGLLATVLAVSSAPPSRTELRRARQRRRHVVIAVGAAALVVILAAAVLASASVFSGDDGDGDGRGAAASAHVEHCRRTTTRRPTAARRPARDHRAGDGRDRTAAGRCRPPLRGGHLPASPTSIRRAARRRTGASPARRPARSTPPTGIPARGPTAATPDRAHGPYPLVLFVHGYDQSPPTSTRRCSSAGRAAGYVVAAPTYPILSGIPRRCQPRRLREDVRRHVVRHRPGARRRGHDPIAGLVDAAASPPPVTPTARWSRSASGSSSAVATPRIRSVIAMAGDLSNANNPSRCATPGMPILHIMETNDEYDPYPHSIDWDRDNLTAPRWMLTL